MKKKLFIGIDFSKETFDVSLLDSVRMDSLDHRCFANTKEGCVSLLKWVHQTGYPSESWLFCGEHTGLYSILLSEFLVHKQLFLWLENPLQIKQSTGIKREKNDKIDSGDIALYAYRFRDRAQKYQLASRVLKSLSLLLSFRDRLLSNKHILSVSSTEIRAVLKRDSAARYIYEQSQKQIQQINKEIKRTEKKMLELIGQDEAVQENYQCITSIKGIALINAVAILVATQNFTCFENSRRFACYSGIAPFGKQSGKSIKTQPHVSHLANKKIKVLLTQAACCAIRYNPDMRIYYERKQKEGKKPGLVINNVRNKLIHCIFALVRTKQVYQENYFQQNNKHIA